MPKILAFAGSNSSKSINFKLVSYVASQVKEIPVEIVDLSKMKVVMFSEDEENNNGYPFSISILHKQIKEANGLLISVNEHNSNPSAFFKNVIDWLSRFDRWFLKDKKVFLMSTSRGARGAKSSLAIVKEILIRFGAEIVETHSLENYNENFSIEEQAIINPEINTEVMQKLDVFIKSIA
jgi:chromate reductase, NAD(P)H dehydrogenase (quinone)